jgi:hypothetical protein
MLSRARNPNEKLVWEDEVQSEDDVLWAKAH